MVYQVQAKNFSSESENRIHSDDVAQRLGFTGALVPGVAVYGHMTHPIVETLGEAWLSSSRTSVRFLKPAYDGDTLSVALQKHESGYEVTCHNADGVLLAQLTTSLDPDTDLHPDRASLDGLPVDPERVGISWDALTLDRPFDPWQLPLDAAGNADYATRVADNQTIYAKLVHPHWLLSTANTALTRQFVMPAWIHVGSEIQHHATVEVGSELTIWTAPIERWRKKGHEFVRLLLNYKQGDKLVTEVLHTAIFRISGT